MTVSSSSSAFRLEPTDVRPVHSSHFAIQEDRLSPSVAGGLAGFVAGVGALATVHGLAAPRFVGSILAAATARGVDFNVSLAVAYVTAAAVGALVGAGFAVVTRYLRKLLPLIVWALVFFGSLSLLLLAGASVYGRSAGMLAGPIVVASAVYGLIVSFSLPIRRRA